MMPGALRGRTALILPLVLLIVVVIEQIASFKLQQKLPDPRVRAAILLVFYGVAFAIAAGWLTPRLTKLIQSARRDSKRRAGTIGLWAFYAAAYGGLYYVFYVMETRGVAALLPVAWR